MPSGGQFSNGSGMRLQTATPGTKDVGNANISGTMLAATFGNNQFPYDTTVVFGKRNSFNAGYTGYTAAPSARDNAIFGQDNNLTGWTTNNTQGTLLVGCGITCSGLYGGDQDSVVIIGNQATINSQQYLSQNNVVIGYGATLDALNPVKSTVIGCSAGANDGFTVCVGYLAQAVSAYGVALGATAKTTSPSNICIGYGAFDNGNSNVINIGSGTIPSGNSNAIRIGVSTQQNVVIGAYRIGISTGGTVKVNDANYIAASTDGTVMYPAITAARTVTLPPAASVPAGYIFRTVDASGAASGVNSITAIPSGTDTIVGPGTPSITSPYGGDRFMSDGVSKWIAANNF